MIDYVNKIVTIILIAILLIMAPLLISYKTEEMIAKREILNDVDTFIEKICDSKQIDASDIDNLYLTVNAHGMVVDVDVERLVYAMALDEGTGEYTYDYVVDKSFINGASTTVPATTILNPNDCIRVTVKETTYSAARRLTYKILRIDENFFEFSLCGMVG